MPLVPPLWHEITAFQREALAPLESSWNTLPLAKKRSWLLLTDKMPAMNPADKAKAQARIQEWAALSPEQRRMARNNYRLAKTLDRDERLASWESYQQMTPEQRSVLRANGWTSNTAAQHAGAPTGLAKQAARPIVVSPTATRPVSGVRPMQPVGAGAAPTPDKRGSPMPASAPGASVGPAGAQEESASGPPADSATGVSSSPAPANSAAPAPASAAPAPASPTAAAAAPAVPAAPGTLPAASASSGTPSGAAAAPAAPSAAPR